MKRVLLCQLLNHLVVLEKWISVKRKIRKIENLLHSASQKKYFWLDVEFSSYPFGLHRSCFLTENKPFLIG
jgi:hypothetical protein